MSAPDPRIPILSALQGISIVGKPSNILNTLQYDSATNTLNWVAGAVGAGMGDLEFLRDKQLAGDLVFARGSVSSVGPVTICSITPAIGKTFFLAKPSMYCVNESGAPNAQTVQLENDVTVKDGGVTESLIDFTIQWIPQITSDALIGDGIKIYRIQKTVGVNLMKVNGTLEGWIQDT